MVRIRRYVKINVVDVEKSDDCIALSVIPPTRQPTTKNLLKRHDVLPTHEHINFYQYTHGWSYGLYCLNFEAKKEFECISVIWFLFVISFRISLLCISLALSWNFMSCKI